MMPRPLRIEYEHAFYHVLNRAVAGASIFPEDTFYQSFLDTLGEACSRFDCLIHAYSLHESQYHLLIETPKANLSRLMRHINGVYTLHYNALMQSDGPLFKGRFKAVVIDCDRYLLPLSRYVHRRPIEIKKPLVTQLSDYRWSSFSAYAGKAKPEAWLAQEQTFQALSEADSYQSYADYVMAGVDDEIAQLYSTSRLPRIIGDKHFKQRIHEQSLPTESNKPATQSALSMRQVIDGVADSYGVSIDDITCMAEGFKKENEARKVAMYLCQELLDAKLTDIANHFHLNHYGSVSYATKQVRTTVKGDGEFRQKLEVLMKKIKEKT
jgi:REP element-mobilizing transposase RayT